MTWFRVDDQMPSHPKTRRIPRAARRNALGTWLILGTYSSKHLTDGLITEDNVLDEGGTKADIKALLLAGLWHAPGDECDHSIEHCPGTPPPGHYQFHDWYDSNPHRTDVLDKRAAEAKRKAEWRENRAAEREAAKGNKTHTDASKDAHVPLGQTRPSPRDNRVRPEHVPLGQTRPSPRDNRVRPEHVPPDEVRLSRSTRPDPTRTGSPTENQGGSGGTAAPPGFDQFWSAYPRKLDKGHARKAWDKAVTRASVAEIIDAAEAFAKIHASRQPGDEKFLPYPATWLNGDRWNDEPASGDASSEVTTGWWNQP